MNTEAQLIEKANHHYNNEHLVAMWNDFCRNNNCDEDIIGHNTAEEVAELFPDSIELYKAIGRGSFNVGECYFRMRNDALVTFSHLRDDNSPIDFRLLAEWVDEQEDDY